MHWIKLLLSLWVHLSSCLNGMVRLPFKIMWETSRGIDNTGGLLLRLLACLIDWLFIYCIKDSEGEEEPSNQVTNGVTNYEQDSVLVQNVTQDVPSTNLYYTDPARNNRWVSIFYIQTIRGYKWVFVRFTARQFSCFCTYLSPKKSEGCFRVWSLSKPCPDLDQPRGIRVRSVG